MLTIIYLVQTSKYLYIHGLVTKCPDSLKFSYFRQSGFNETFAPDVCDNEDSRSESRHPAKKFEKYFCITNRPCNFFRNRKLCFIKIIQNM